MKKLALILSLVFVLSCYCLATASEQRFGQLKMTRSAFS